MKECTLRITVCREDTAGCSKMPHVLKYLPIPYKKRWMQRLIRAAMNSVGLEHFVLHDLRHSTASMLINNDVDLHTIGATLGHKDKTSTDRYSHLTAKTLARAINKIR